MEADKACGLLSYSTVVRRKTSIRLAVSNHMNARQSSLSYTHCGSSIHDLAAIGSADNNFFQCVASTRLCMHVKEWMSEAPVELPDPSQSSRPLIISKKVFLKGENQDPPDNHAFPSPAVDFNKMQPRMLEVISDNRACSGGQYSIDWF
jgi:hypothetical protein